MLSLLYNNTHTHTKKQVCVQIHRKGNSSSNPSALSRRMWGSFNTSNRNYTALQVSQNGDGFIFLHTFPWWNLPTSRHKPIKADAKAVIYKPIMLPPAHVCVCWRKKSERFSWDRHLTFVESDNIFRMWPKKRNESLLSFLIPISYYAQFIKQFRSGVTL